MISILIDIIKVNIATIRWGKLTSSDEELITNSSFKKILNASYIKKTNLSHSHIVTLG